VSVWRMVFVCVCVDRCVTLTANRASRGTTRDTSVNLAATNSQPGFARIIQLNPAHRSEPFADSESNLH
jgi:hypothetical protein